MWFIDRLLIAVLAAGILAVAITPLLPHEAEADHYVMPTTAEDMEEFVLSVVMEWCWVEAFENAEHEIWCF
jgi:hypothetical protein